MLFRNWKTHIVLRRLYKVWESGKESSSENMYHPTSGKTLDTNNLGFTFCNKVKHIKQICYNLEVYQYIKYLPPNKEEPDKSDKKKSFQTLDNNPRYFITDKGIKAYIDKFFLLKINNFFREWIPIVISLCAILISVKTCGVENSNKKEIENTNIQIQQLKQSINSIENNQLKIPEN